MKQHEHRLLDRLSNNYHTEDVPLNNVRDALGSIAYTKGNPLTKTEITLNIDSWFFDVGANVFVAPAAMPAALQLSAPIWLFGLTDYYGGYLKSNAMTPIIAPWGVPLILVTIGIVGYNAVPAGLGTPTVVRRGDLLIQLQTNFAGTTYLYIIRVRCENVSYGTFLNSFVSDLITINSIRLIVPIANVNQYINTLQFGYQTLFGKFYQDSIDPRMYITSRDFQQQVCDIPLNLPIDKSVMFNYYMNFDCQHMSIILFVDKVEPLTHK